VETDVGSALTATYNPDGTPVAGKGKGGLWLLAALGAVAFS
jgi:hypothetical protein